MKRTNSLKWQPAILAVVAMVSSAWAQQPEGAYTSTLNKTKATITAINQAAREVTVQGRKGPMTVKAGPEVKDFNNLKVGDQVLGMQSLERRLGTCSHLGRGRHAGRAEEIEAENQQLQTQQQIAAQSAQQLAVSRQKLANYNLAFETCMQGRGYTLN